MDDKKHGKPYEQMDDLGVLYHYFWKHPYLKMGFSKCEVSSKDRIFQKWFPLCFLLKMISSWGSLRKLGTNLWFPIGLLPPGNQPLDDFLSKKSPLGASFWFNFYWRTLPETNSNLAPENGKGAPWKFGDSYSWKPPFLGAKC